MAILDTNVLIRLLTRDEPAQSERALKLLQDVESGQRSVTLLEGVLLETIQVLSFRRSYNLDRESIQRSLIPILRLPGVRIANKQTYLEALNLYVEYSRLSFVDALCIAYARHSDDKTVISFDRDFRNLPDVVWEQP